MMFDYIAKAGKHRTIIVRDRAVLPTVRALAYADNGLETLFCYQHSEAWHSLHSHQVNEYLALRAGGHFTAKDFRTWNATVLMALVLANAGPSPTPPRSRKKVVAASVREVAQWLGDTPSVTRGSYIDPRLITRYESAGRLPTIPALPTVLRAPAEAGLAVARAAGRRW
jgi:DNA topoisomerase IB